VAISRDGFADGAASVVVLARADLAPDALAGTPLAFARGGPLLLTSSASLVDVVAEEIVRVLPPGGTVVLLGGDAALEPAVEVALQGLGFATERIAGASRVETSVAVAGALGGVGGVSAALVSTGDTFADALPAGAAAARVGGAVLLVHGDRPHAAVSAYLAEHAGVEVFAVGGPAGRAYPQAQPLVGATREDTAVAVAARFFPAAQVVGIARRDDFPDALAGGAHMAVRGGPVLLTPTAALHPTVGAHLCASTAIEAAVVYGGTAAISPATADAIAAAITGDGC
jgi:hypothetical protein